MAAYRQLLLSILLVATAVLAVLGIQTTSVFAAENENVTDINVPANETVLVSNKTGPTNQPVTQADYDRLQNEYNVSPNGPNTITSKTQDVQTVESQTDTGKKTRTKTTTTYTISSTPDQQTASDQSTNQNNGNGQENPANPSFSLDPSQILPVAIAIGVPIATLPVVIGVPVVIGSVALANAIPAATVLGVALNAVPNRIALGNLGALHALNDPLLNFGGPIARGIKGFVFPVPEILKDHAEDLALAAVPGAAALTALPGALLAAPLLAVPGALLAAPLLAVPAALLAAPLLAVPVILTGAALLAIPASILPAFLAGQLSQIPAVLAALALGNPFGGILPAFAAGVLAALPLLLDALIPAANLPVLAAYLLGRASMILPAFLAFVLGGVLGSIIPAAIGAGLLQLLGLDALLDGLRNLFDPLSLLNRLLRGLRLLTLENALRPLGAIIALLNPLSFGGPLLRLAKGFVFPVVEILKDLLTKVLPFAIPIVLTLGLLNDLLPFLAGLGLGVLQGLPALLRVLPLIPLTALAGLWAINHLIPLALLLGGLLTLQNLGGLAALANLLGHPLTFGHPLYRFIKGFLHPVRELLQGLLNPLTWLGFPAGFLLGLAIPFVIGFGLLPLLVPLAIFAGIDLLLPLLLNAALLGGILPALAGLWVINHLLPLIPIAVLLGGAIGFGIGFLNGLILGGLKDLADLIILGKLLPWIILADLIGDLLLAQIPAILDGIIGWILGSLLSWPLLKLLGLYAFTHLWLAPLVLIQSILLRTIPWLFALVGYNLGHFNGFRHALELTFLLNLWRIPAALQLLKQLLLTPLILGVLNALTGLPIGRMIGGGVDLASGLGIVSGLFRILLMLFAGIVYWIALPGIISTALTAIIPVLQFIINLAFLDLARILTNFAIGITLTNIVLFGFDLIGPLILDLLTLLDVIAIPLLALIINPVMALLNIVLIALGGFLLSLMQWLPFKLILNSSYLIGVAVSVLTVLGLHTAGIIAIINQILINKLVKIGLRFVMLLNHGGIFPFIGLQLVDLLLLLGVGLIPSVIAIVDGILAFISPIKLPLLMLMEFNFIPLEVTGTLFLINLVVVLVKNFNALSILTITNRALLE